MNAAARHIAENPVNINVCTAFSVNSCDTSLYLGVKQLMAGGGVALIGITLVPLLSGLFG